MIIFGRTRNLHYSWKDALKAPFIYNNSHLKEIQQIKKAPYITV